MLSLLRTLALTELHMHTISMRHDKRKSPAQVARHSSRGYCFSSYNIRIGIWREYFDLCNGEGIFRPKASSTKLHEPTICSQLRNNPRKEYCQSSGNPREKPCAALDTRYLLRTSGSIARIILPSAMNPLGHYWLPRRCDRSVHNGPKSQCSSSTRWQLSGKGST